MASAIRSIPRIFSQKLRITSSRCAGIASSRSMFARHLSQSNQLSLQDTMQPWTTSNLFSKSVFTTHRRLMSTEELSPETIKERVMSCLKLYDKIKPEDLTEECHFMKDLGLDSLDHVEIIVAIENEFSVEIPDDVAETLLTPSAVIKCIIDRMEVEST